MKKLILNIIGILLAMFLKSCSSYSLNIDTKLFVSRIGIDVNDDGNISLCFSYPDISGFSAESSSIKESGSICGYGKTFYEAVKDASAKSHKIIDLEHAKVVIISSELMNDYSSLEKLVDYLSHNPQISRRIYICIGNGKAYDFLNFKSESLPYSQDFISDLIENNVKENGLRLSTLNSMLNYSFQNKTILIPALELNEDKTSMDVCGSGVLRNYRLIKRIDLKDTMLINLLRGDNFRIIDDIEYGNSKISFEAENTKRNVKLLDYGNVNLSLNFNTVINNCSNSEHMYINEKFISDIKNTLDMDVYNQCMNLLNKFYRNGIDILNFEDFAYKFYTKTWHRFITENSNWMESLSVNLKIHNNIVNIGNISF